VIVNLVGPPAAGKSTFAAKFVLEHTFFNYACIDEFRIKLANEREAWTALKRAVKASESIILETCGLNYRLSVLFNDPDIRKRPIFTIAFQGRTDILEQRLTERQKRQVPHHNHPLLNYTPEDERNAIRYVMANINKTVAPVDYRVDVSKKTEKEIYEELSSLIVAKRLEFNVQHSSTVEKKVRTPILFDDESLR
jgi:hypothetical protein